MALERIYTIPLRKAFLKAPKYKRTKRAINAIKAFTIRHMKCDNVKIGKYLNIEMWKHGRKNPPSKIQVRTIKDKKKIKDKEVEFVSVELINAPVEKKVEVKKKSMKEKLLGKATAKPKEEPSLEKKVHEEKKEKSEEENKLEKEKKEVLEHEKPKEPAKTKEDTKYKSIIKSEGFKKSKIIGRTSKK